MRIVFSLNILFNEQTTLICNSFHRNYHKLDIYCYTGFLINKNKKVSIPHCSIWKLTTSTSPVSCLYELTLFLQFVSSFWVDKSPSILDDFVSGYFRGCLICKASLVLNLFWKTSGEKSHVKMIQCGYKTTTVTKIISITCEAFVWGLTQTQCEGTCVTGTVIVLSQWPQFNIALIILAVL